MSIAALNRRHLSSAVLFHCLSVMTAILLTCTSTNDDFLNGVEVDALKLSLKPLFPNLFDLANGKEKDPPVKAGPDEAQAPYHQSTQHRSDEAQAPYHQSTQHLSMVVKPTMYGLAAGEWGKYSKVLDTQGQTPPNGNLQHIGRGRSLTKPEDVDRSDVLSNAAPGRMMQRMTWDFVKGLEVEGAKAQNGVAGVTTAHFGNIRRSPNAAESAFVNSLVRSLAIMTNFNPRA